MTSITSEKAVELGAEIGSAIPGEKKIENNNEIQFLHISDRILFPEFLFPFFRFCVKIPLHSLIS